jgi:hypothetical protein
MQKHILALALIIYMLQLNAQPVKVEVKKTGERYMLYRNGQPFFVKGGGGYFYYDKLKECGGNSIRIWGTEGADYALEQAGKNGITVMLGLDVGRERLGFDYNNTAAVKKQLEDIKKVVLKYKDHPALLMWAVGNELEHYANNDKVWDAVKDIVDMIHKVDPNHPTTTILAGVPRQHVRLIMEKCPNIDILSFNAFKDLPYVPYKIHEAGWNGPYLITEWGSSGYWESDLTAWKAGIEETSSEKANAMKYRYEAAIKKDSAYCLGSYVFYWGQRQERTHTFLSMFLESGEKTACVDVLQNMWTGQWPGNRSPMVDSMRIDGMKAQQNIYMLPGSTHNAKVFAYDPERENLTYRWELYYESIENKTGGDKEEKPAIINDLIDAATSAEVKFKAPAQEGAYRLFVYVSDGNKNVGTANIPFRVSAKKQ